MKKTIILFALAAFSINVNAQTDSTTIEDSNWQPTTLFSSGSGGIESGFYGGLMTRYGQVDGDGAFLFGGKGAWIINHSIGIGIAGNSIINKSYSSANNSVIGGYFGGNGGFLIEPILFSDRPVHIALPVTIGGGFIGKYYWVGQDFWDNGDYVAYGYVEPGIEIEANIVKWFRISVGAYYAFRWDIDAFDMNSDIISPLSLGASFKFGIF